MASLVERSIEIILANQDATGAYIASPNFFSYRYCWFRDGSYTAYAMDLVGEHNSAARFHRWAAQVVNQRAGIIKRGIEKANQGVPLSESDVLSTRYELDGTDSIEDWPNFQLDGFGTWLWALREHASLSSQIVPVELSKAANLVSDYLAALWRHPCFDCWEEFPDQIHMYTLAAIYAGLNTHSQLNTNDQSRILKQIKRLILSEGTQLGYFPKFIGSSKVDANLLGLAVPYNVVKPDHSFMVNTLSLIESDLRKGGGVHRYTSDTYFGGGEWILLTAWLGWIYAVIGQTSRAEQLLTWISKQADERGFLPEQVPKNLSNPSYYKVWVQRWGEIANPLLWSHAMYIILHHALNSK